MEAERLAVVRVRLVVARPGPEAVQVFREVAQVHLVVAPVLHEAALALRVAVPVLHGEQRVEGRQAAP